MIASYLLAALIVVHIAGSLRHHFMKRNDVMRRMWFGSSRPRRQPHTDPARRRLRQKHRLVSRARPQPNRKPITVEAP